MNILQDISGHDQLVAMAAMVEGITSLPDDELLERIPEAESAGMALHIYAGCMYIELKRRHPGRFRDIVELQLDRTLDEVEDLMFIAREFPDPSQWKHLPGHKTTVRILGRIPREIRDQWIREGKINVTVTKAVAKKLVLEARAEIGADGDHDGCDDHDGRDDHSGCDDDGGDGDHDDAEQDQDRPGPQPANQVVVTRKNSDTDSNSENERLQAHIEEQNAYSSASRQKRNSARAGSKRSSAATRSWRR
jgi:hypothetical protein